MRARNIKPGFFKNEELAEIEPLGRLLFAGLWCMADREGRLEDRPKRIKAEILPYDDCNVDLLLNNLALFNFLIRYSVDNTKYIQIVKFSKHQTPHMREPESTIPAPEQHSASTIPAPEQHTPGPSDFLIPDSSVLIPDSNIKPPRKNSASKKIKVSLPENFAISDEVKLWAVKHGFTDIEQHLERFVELCQSNGYTAVDWDCKFKRAIREDWGKVRNGNGNARLRDGPDQSDIERARQWALKKDAEKHGKLATV